MKKKLSSLEAFQQLMAYMQNNKHRITQFFGLLLDNSGGFEMLNQLAYTGNHSVFTDVNLEEEKPCVCLAVMNHAGNVDAFFNYITKETKETFNALIGSDHPWWKTQIIFDNDQRIVIFRITDCDDTEG